MKKKRIQLTTKSRLSHKEWYDTLFPKLYSLRTPAYPRSQETTAELMKTIQAINVIQVVLDELCDDMFFRLYRDGAFGIHDK
jgi:hypothetical protein